MQFTWLMFQFRNTKLMIPQIFIGLHVFIGWSVCHPSLLANCGINWWWLLKFIFVQALIWSKMSTGFPIEISSSMKRQNYISFCRLDIDIHRYVLNIGNITNVNFMVVIGSWKCTQFMYASLFVGILVLVIILMAYLKLSGIFLTFICMKNETTRRSGMELEFK